MTYVDSLISISDTKDLRVGRAGFDSSHVQKLSSPPLPDWLWGPLSLLSSGTAGDIPRKYSSRSGCEGDHSPHLVSRLRSRALHDCRTHYIIISIRVKRRSVTLILVLSSKCNTIWGQS